MALVPGELAVLVRLRWDGFAASLSCSARVGASGGGRGESVLHRGLGVMCVWLNVACCPLRHVVASPGVPGERELAGVTLLQG